MSFFIYLIVFLVPLSLIRFKIFWVPFNLIEILIYILFFWWLFFYSKDLLWKIKKLKPKFCLSAIFLIFVGVTLSVWFSSDLQLSAGIWKEWFIAPWLFSLVLFSLINNRKQIILLLLSLFTSGLLVALIALFYWWIGDLTYDQRLKAFYLSPNYLAMYLAPVLIFGFFLWFFTKKRIYKILLIIGCALIAMALYLTYSYGAWIGLLLAVIVLIILFQLSRRKKFLILLILFFILGGMFFWQLPTDKAQNLVYSSRSSFHSRLMIWRSSWEIIKDHPFIGIGPGTFQKYYLSYQKDFQTPYLEWAVPYPHNVFISFYLQSGLLGLFGFLWLLFLWFKKMLSNKNLISIFFIGFMIYFIVHGLVDTTYWKADLSFVFWLVIVLSYKAVYLFGQQKEDNFHYRK